MAEMVAKQCKLQSQYCVASLKYPEATINAVIAHPNHNCSNDIELVATNTINLWFKQITSLNQSDVNSCCGRSFLGKHTLMLLNDQLKSVGIAATRFKKSTNYAVDYLVLVFGHSINAGSPVYAPGPFATGCQQIDSSFKALCREREISLVF